MSPRKRTSPWRPSSARATEIFILEVSRPTTTALSCCMARPRCVRLGTGLSGAILVRRIARDEPPPLQQRTYGLPLDLRSGRVAPLPPTFDLTLQGVLMGDTTRHVWTPLEEQEKSSGAVWPVVGC